MAQKVLIRLVDDLDGSEASQTVQFGLDGTSYEIDLNDENAGRLRQSLAEFVSSGRSVKKAGKSSKPKSPTSKTRVDDPKAIRSWAKTKGIDVPDRGRVPNDVRERYLSEAV